MALTRVFVYDAVSADEPTDAPSDVENWLTERELIDVHVRRGQLATAVRRIDDDRRASTLAGGGRSFRRVQRGYDVALVAGDADFARS